MVPIHRHTHSPELRHGGHKFGDRGYDDAVILHLTMKKK